MELKQVNNPVATIIHWALSSGLLISVVTFANSTENQTLENQTKLEQVQTVQKEIQTDIKDGRNAQREIRDLLIEIKTKQDQQQ